MPAQIIPSKNLLSTQQKTSLFKNLNSEELNSAIGLARLIQKEHDSYFSIEPFMNEIERVISNHQGEKSASQIASI